MLLIDRKKGMAVIITTKSSEEIKVTVVGDSKYGVKLGFEADTDIKILREEVLDRDKQ